MKTEYPKLPKAFKRKWIAALRSGKFKQGYQSLKEIKEDGPKCCLGVACEIAGAKVVLKQNPGFIDGGTGSIKGIKKIPKMLIGCSGLPEKLAHMNDQERPRRVTFKGIAQWIERNL